MNMDMALDDFAVNMVIPNSYVIPPGSKGYPKTVYVPGEFTMLRRPPSSEFLAVANKSERATTTNHDFRIICHVIMFAA